MKQASFKLGETLEEKVEEKVDEKTNETNIQEDTKNSSDILEINSSNKSKKPIKRVENIYYF